MQNKEQGLFRHQLLLRVASWRSRGVYLQASTMLPGPEFDSMSPQLYGEREYQQDGSLLTSRAALTPRLSLLLLRGHLTRTSAVYNPAVQTISVSLSNNC